MAGVSAGGGAAVTTRGLSVRYGRTVALQGVDVSLPRGAVTALVGPNGSGKSSLLLAACGLVPAAAGEVSVLGRPARPPGGRTWPWCCRRRPRRPRCR